MVDVGGGIGSLEMALTKKYPSSGPNFVIFDIQKTIGNAREVSGHLPMKSCLTVCCCRHGLLKTPTSSHVFPSSPGTFSPLRLTRRTSRVGSRRTSSGMCSTTGQTSKSSPSCEMFVRQCSLRRPGRKISSDRR